MLETRRPRRGPIVLAGCAIVLAIVAAYINSHDVPFVLDDFVALAGNRSIQTLRSVGQILSPPGNSPLGGRPLANLSFALNYAWAGDNVASYHAVNLLVHVLNALLLFGVLRRAFRLGRAAGASGPSAAGWRAEPWLLSATCALLWAVHPVLTAAVTYISQRTEVMMAFFYLATLYGFVRGIESGSRRWLALSVVACFAGMAVKEVMVTAPLLVLWFDRTWLAGGVSAAWRTRRGYYLGLFASWLLLAALLSTGLAQRGVGFGLGISGWRYGVKECEALATYLRLAIWPSPLVFDYGPVFDRSIGAALANVAVVAAVVAGGIFGLARRPALGFFCGAFLLPLLPTSTIVPIVYQPIAENRVYLPLIAVVVALVLGVHRAITRQVIPVAIAAICAAACLTWQRNEIFRSDVTLWRDTVSKSPRNFRAHASYSGILTRLDRLDEAVREGLAAVALNPRDPVAHNNLAAAYNRAGNYALALEHGRAALRLSPNVPSACCNNIGESLLHLGQPARALPYLQRAVRDDPDYVKGLNNAAIAELVCGRAGDAVAHLRRAAQLEPHGANTLANLGAALLQVNRAAEAIPWLERATQLDPGHAHAHFNLGTVYLATGRSQDAVLQLEAATRHDPGNSAAHNNLGLALLRLGRISEAEVSFHRALQLSPDYADAKANLALAESLRPAQPPAAPRAP